MSKHTPGPWAPNGGLIGTYIEGRKNWTLVADAKDDGSSSMEPGEAEANTNLIASAPNLLRLLVWALPEVESRLKQYLSDGGIGMSEDFDCLYEAKELVKRLGGWG